MSPFHITGPAIISVSGGRTSGYMLHRILQAHGGTLPADVRAVFANTGREMPATLDFVRDMEAHWGVRITWLEYRRQPRPGKRAVITAEVVSHNSASRAGEPFDALLTGKKIVPDPTRRFCTEELKVSTIKRWVRAELGWRQWSNVVGLRADETVRLERRRAKEESPEWGAPWRSSFPLAAAGVTALDVMRFWKSQPFDLRLRDRAEGNCDGCFMKSSWDIGQMFHRYPERMEWWVQKEAQLGTKTMVAGRPFAAIQAQKILAWDDAQPCDEGCGI
jgi:3'-phosphoadenosine 5'-phosphosulfate sulfotransferase (PAPS reductase)/FAD synthetase